MRKITATFLTLVLLIIPLSACKVIVLPEITKSYSVGDAIIDSSVTSLIVDWSDGSINVISSDTNRISIAEVSDSELTEKTSMSWWIEDKTLHISYVGKNIFTVKNLKKDLTITLPKDFIGKIIDLSSSAADIHADLLSADQVTLSTSSGDLDAAVTAKHLNFSSSSGKLRLVAEADEINGSSSSGDIDLTQNGICEEVKLSSSSGKITTILASVDKFDASTSSGDVSTHAKTVGEINCSTSSAEIGLTVTDTLKYADLESSSGNVSLHLPDCLDFNAEIETNSGGFTSDFALVTKHDHHIHGAGTAEIEIETSSGNIEVIKNK